MIEYCGIFVSGGLVFTELCMKSIYIFTKWNIIYNNRAKYVHRNLILNYMYFFIVLVSLLLSYQIKVLQRENCVYQYAVNQLFSHARNICKVCESLFIVNISPHESVFAVWMQWHFNCEWMRLDRKNYIFVKSCYKVVTN